MNIPLSNSKSMTIVALGAALAIGYLFSCPTEAAPGVSAGKGSSSEASGTSSGSSPGNPGPAPGGAVSSPVQQADGVHQWTAEEMLLARAMPMSKEGRDFAFGHKAPESIRTWTLGEFHEYTRTLNGRNELKVEGQRWLGIKLMLKKQIALGKAFFANPKNFQPWRKKSKRRGNGVASGAGNSPESSGPEFDEGSFEAGESASTFERLKACRQDIHDLCHALDEMKKLASRRGRLDEFERAITSE